MADTLGWGQMYFLGYKESRALGLFLPLLLSRFQCHLLSSVFGGVSRVLLSLLAKLCCVCPPLGVRHPEAARKDAHSQPCSRKLPLQQPKVFLSLLFPVHHLPLWMRPFPRSQLPGLEPGFAVASARGDGKELGLGRDLPCTAGFPEGLRAVPILWGEQQGWEVWDQPWAT